MNSIFDNIALVGAILAALGLSALAEPPLPTEAPALIGTAFEAKAVKAAALCPTHPWSIRAGL